ncbi:MAG: hypothetical protein RL477_1356 [Pseudomonadota bacterium]|jgi:tripartite-type tricarboxylate transporter receptor subunit TctC
MKIFTAGIAAAAIAAALIPAAAGAQAQEFYKGKTVKVIIGSGEGSGVDVLSRLVVRHIGKHIPGNPSVIANNMAQPQSIAAANFVANVAKPDGLTIGSGSAGLFSRAISQPNIRFSLDKLTWLANLYGATVVMWMRTDFPCQTVEALKACPQRLKFAATARGSTGYGLVPEILKEAFGLKMDIIYGYREGQLMLAMEQGEAQASGGDLIAFFAGRPKDLMKEGKVKILMQVSGKKTPLLEPYNVPWVMDSVPESHKGLFAMVNPMIDMARPFFGAPGLAADRTASLRKAFADLAADKAFQDDVRKAARIDVDYTAGAEMAPAIKAMLDQPEDVKKRVIELLGSGQKKKKKQ